MLLQLWDSQCTKRSVAQTITLDTQSFLFLRMPECTLQNVNTCLFFISGQSGDPTDRIQTSSHDTCSTVRFSRRKIRIDAYSYKTRFSSYPLWKWVNFAALYWKCRSLVPADRNKIETLKREILPAFIEINVKIDTDFDDFIFLT